MGAIAERAAGGPKCPSCGGRSVVELNRSEAAQRYECGSCFHNWAVPIPPGLRLALDGENREPGPGPEKEEAEVAKLECGKCGREFKHGKRKSNHEKKCDGPPARARRAAAGSRRTSAGRRPASSAVDGAGEAVRGAIAELEARREDLRKELEDLEGALGTLRETQEKLEALDAGVGGGDLEARPTPARPAGGRVGRTRRRA